MSESQPPPPMTEPEIFRRIFLGIYVILLVGFVGTISVSATYGAFFAPTEPGSSAPATDADCETRLARLFESLDARGQALLARAHETETAKVWKAFSDRFRGQLIAARTQCGSDEPALARLADDLERHRLGYETALRSLMEIAGPSRLRLVDALRAPGASLPPADGID